MIRHLAAAALGILLAGAAPAAAPSKRDRAVPHADHVIVVIEENKGYRTIFDGALAPHVAALARTYGSATEMFAERHPSEPNYVALLAGSTFGIADDDAWYCTAGSTQPNCKGSGAPGFVTHLIEGPNLATQLAAKGLRWRAYLEDLPAPGSLAIFSPETPTAPAALYAAKHTGFTNFASVHRDPALSRELVGFDALHADLARGTLPAFALIVPNQCDEMHGLASPKAPLGCTGAEPLVRRGDAQLGMLVDEIRASPIWTAPHVNTAVVVTWDEDDKADRRSGGPQSCCVVDADDPGGGHIPTIVITNNGPRHRVDATPYDHYSLLRTIEDALRLDGHLRHADDPTVLPMTPLFAP